MRKNILVSSVEEIDRLSAPLGIAIAVGFWVGVFVIAYLKAV